MHKWLQGKNIQWNEIERKGNELSKSSSALFIDGSQLYLQKASYLLYSLKRMGWERVWLNRIYKYRQYSVHLHTAVQSKGVGLITRYQVFDTDSGLLAYCPLLLVTFIDQ